MATVDPRRPAGRARAARRTTVSPIVDPETLKLCAAAILDQHGRVTNPTRRSARSSTSTAPASFEGYYKNDVADADRVRNGWYWTGDLGYVDEAGFLYFAGRRGDWIRVDGENISALTIERVLRRHPAVVAAAVYGVPDPRSGDQVMAALEVADPEAFDTPAFARPI